MESDVEVNSSPSRLNNIFQGPQGIRAGWSIALFVLILGITTTLFIVPTNYLLSKIHVSLDESAPLQLCAMELSTVLGVLTASMLMALIEHKPLISYGLEGTKRLINFCFGLLWGVVALSALVGILYISGFLVFNGIQLHGVEIILYAIAWGIAFFLVGFFEEYLFRGYLLSTGARGLNFWWSAVIFSVLFGCVHISNQGESFIGVTAAALIGFAFCLSLYYTKSLWWAIGFHASWDWSESYLWGTADSGKAAVGHLFGTLPQGNVFWSGGLTGPEGSIFIIPVILIIIFTMWVVWRKNKKETYVSENP